ncbi:hypothetical protein GCM10027570_07100 [Streptomonospora sediminis]
MEVSVPLFLELGAVLVVLSLIAAGARRWGLSPVPLYLLAGLVLGEGGVAPVPAAGDFIGTGAAIGMGLLLLMLGVWSSPRRSSPRACGCTCPPRCWMRWRWRSRCSPRSGCTGRSTGSSTPATPSSSCCASWD